MNSTKISKLCTASNIGWIIISTIGIVGGVSNNSDDHLFTIRYALAFASSGLSLISIKLFPKRVLGRLSILLFAPFIVIEVAEIMAVYNCSAGVESVWGIDCTELVMYRDDSRYLELVTDQLAVLILALANMWILWRCHMTHGHMIYDMKKFRKSVSAEPFLSAVSSDNGVSEFISADEEGVSPEKVYIILSFLFISLLVVGLHKSTRDVATSHRQVSKRAASRGGSDDYGASEPVCGRREYEKAIGTRLVALVLVSFFGREESVRSAYQP